MKWDDYFNIETEYINDGDYHSHYQYKIVVKATKEIVGTYKDNRYAIKQAKYKFKKISNRVEKILLG